MAALQCDLCGGKIVGKAGGLFECGNCGMEYDAEWAKTKLHIEAAAPASQSQPATPVAPIEVKVTDIASVENLLRRGKSALGERGWNVAINYFNQVLDIDDSCSEAYLGLAMAVYQYANYDDVQKAYYDIEFEGSDLRLLENANFIRAKNNATGQLLEQFQKWETTAELLKAQVEETRNIKRKEMQEARLRLGDVSNHISADSRCFGIQADTSVLVTPPQIPTPFDGTKAVAGWTDVKAIAPGGSFVLGLTIDGTVRMAGSSGNIDTSNWTNITAISTSSLHAVGLRDDGTVVASGLNDKGQCNVSDWRDIVAISASGWHTVGVTSNGTVVATGKSSSFYNASLDIHVRNWKDIVDVATGSSFTVGLCADGSLIPVGDFARPDYVVDLCEWTDIVAISAHDGTVVGLKADGSVVATGYNFYGECNVQTWCDVVAISAGKGKTLGLRSDGTVLIATNSQAEKDKIQDWKLFNSFETLKEEKNAAMPKANWKRNGLCQHCGNSFKGLFTKTCSNCGKVKDY